MVNAEPHGPHGVIAKTQGVTLLLHHYQDGEPVIINWANVFSAEQEGDKLNILSAGGEIDVEESLETVWGSLSGEPNQA